MRIQIKVKNLDEVVAKLKEQPEIARAVHDKAVEAAADVILEIAKSKAPGPGLDKSRVGMAKYNVGPTKDKWYYRFFESGTAAHLVRPKKMKALKFGEQYAMRAKPGAMAAKPFLRPAIDEGKDRASAAAGEVFEDAFG